MLMLVSTRNTAATGISSAASLRGESNSARTRTPHGTPTPISTARIPARVHHKRRICVCFPLEVKVWRSLAVEQLFTQRTHVPENSVKIQYVTSFTNNWSLTMTRNSFLNRINIYKSFCCASGIGSIRMPVPYIFLNVWKSFKRKWLMLIINTRIA